MNKTEHAWLSGILNAIGNMDHDELEVILDAVGERTDELISESETSILTAEDLPPDEMPEALLEEEKERCRQEGEVRGLRFALTKLERLLPPWLR